MWPSTFLRNFGTLSKNHLKKKMNIFWGENFNKFFSFLTYFFLKKNSCMHMNTINIPFMYFFMHPIFFLNLESY